MGVVWTRGIARLLSNGAPDPDFHPFAGFDVAEQPDGGGVLSRWSYVSVPGESSLVRLVDDAVTSLRLISPAWTRDGKIQFKVAMPDRNSRHSLIETSDDLQHWSPFQSFVTDGALEVLTTGPAPQSAGQFFRAVATASLHRISSPDWTGSVRNRCGPWRLNNSDAPQSSMSLSKPASLNRGQPSPPTPPTRSWRRCVRTIPI